MSYLIDTNIISEVRKGTRCDAHVSAWYASVADEDIFLSTLVLGEIRRGVELVQSSELGQGSGARTLVAGIRGGIQWARSRHR